MFNIKYSAKKDMRELLECVQAEYDKQVNLVDYFRKKCEAFRKDNEIQKLEKKAAELRMYSIHVLSEKEYINDTAFRKAHCMSCRNEGTFQYELTETGAGTIIFVRCPVCGKSKDITDTSSWKYLTGIESQ